MIQVKDNYQLLIEKLDQFIRKFYVDHLIRGGLFSLGLILLLFVGFNVLEYYCYFSTTIRKILFYSFMGVSALALYQWVLVPLFHFYRLGKVITHHQAANIIGNHFTDVKDKLLNILQLKQQSTNSAQAELIMASINQKSNEIKFVPFKAAIDLTENRKNLRFVLPPLFLLLGILAISPNIIRDATKRLFDNNTAYSRPAPFVFNVKKDSLTVVQFADFDLNVKVDGEALPNEMFIDIDNYQYRLNKIDANTFGYKFANVQKEMDFKLFAGGFNSENYTLNVLKKPNVTGFELDLDYPAYVGRPDETMSNVGDVVVPLGTNLNWLFKTQNTENIKIKFGSSQAELKRDGAESFIYKKMALTDESYKVFISNALLPNADSLAYTITIIPDLYPTINVEKFVDSTNTKVLFFAGDAGDDYGLRGLGFNFRIKHGDGSQGELVSYPISKPEGKQVQYQHTFDISKLELKPGDELTYYFEIFDNDAINGSKSSRTNLMSYNVPTLEQVEQQKDKTNEEIQKELEKAFKDTKKNQEELQKMREKLLQKKELDWQDKKQLENMLNKQKEIEKQMEQAKQNFEKNQQLQNEFQKPDQEILKKQEQLEKLFNELQNDEMKKLMEDIEKMMQNMQKDEALDKMEQMQLNNEELNMELDRMTELFKQLKVEEKQQQQIDKLEELAKKQEDLAKQTENKEKSKEELEKKQDELNKEFDKFKEDQKELEKMNEDLQRKKDIDKIDEEMKDIDSDMDDSKKEISNGDDEKASKKQKKASKKMKSTANKMKAKKKKAQAEELEEDMAVLRQILENLVTLSFGQEELQDRLPSIPINTPAYIGSVQEQNKIKDNFKIVEDSLVALSKRQSKIESFVTEKVAKIKQSMRKSITELEERQVPEAGGDQRKSMQAMNDLALMLSETLSDMQQQMGEQQDGNQECNKPGKAKGKQGQKPADQMSKGQKEINDGMKKMKEGLKQGKEGTSQEFAKMAAKQAAMRNALRQMQTEKKQQGQGSKELEEAINQMDKTETELVNKRLTEETMKRQEEIITRLLEAERAEREREYDNKRKADQARAIEPKSPPTLQDYLKKRESELEAYRTVSPNLRPYYKKLVQDYVKHLKKS